jgi:hypothetical protein
MRRVALLLLLAGAGCRDPVFRDIDGLFRSDADPCARCKIPAGENHQCGYSTWCYDCRQDISLQGHICSQTHYCKKCRREEAAGLHDGDANGP